MVSTNKVIKKNLKKMVPVLIKGCVLGGFGWISGKLNLFSGKLNIYHFGKILLLKIEGWNFIIVYMVSTNNVFKKNLKKMISGLGFGGIWETSGKLNLLFEKLNLYHFGKILLLKIDGWNSIIAYIVSTNNFFKNNFENDDLRHNLGVGFGEVRVDFWKIEPFLW